jgi:hypothetical protein
LSGNSLEGALRRTQIKLAGNLLGGGRLADNHRLAQWPGQLSEERAQALFASHITVGQGQRRERRKHQQTAQQRGCEAQMQETKNHRLTCLKGA